MSVKQSLLAILDQGPCYGYQLRHEFGRRTGAARPLNVGQIYNTLERLERDGLVERGETDAQGHVFFSITDAGRDEVRGWWQAPVVRTPGTRDELPVKLALAATLPGVDVAEVIRTQRDASAARLRELEAAQPQEPDTTRPHEPGTGRPQEDSTGHAQEPDGTQTAGDDPDDPGALARELMVEAMRLAAEAEVRWLDHAARRLAQYPHRAVGLGLSTDRPRRGRPAASAG